MRAGDTFLVPAFDDHLWIIISDPAVDSDNVVIVLLVSWAEKYDQACVLNSGEHPFIKHATCVQYRGAKVASDARLEQLKLDGCLKQKVPVTDELLGKIRSCAENGDLPSAAYEILREQGFVP